MERYLCLSRHPDIYIGLKINMPWGTYVLENGQKTYMYMNILWAMKNYLIC